MTEIVAPSQANGGDAAVDTEAMHGIGDGFAELVRSEVAEFLSARASELAEHGEGAGEWIQLAVDSLHGGKCLRPRFAYLGWLARAEGSAAALRGAASFELLHTFALIQDDVMDESDLRRGRATAHRALSVGRSERYGESAATLLADLCLVWAEQMLRTCGLPFAAYSRALPYYDGMRQELAVGQYLDLGTDHQSDPTLAGVRQTARLKSARYTVTGPLVIGAALAGAEPALRGAFGNYGDAIGEAFQMRDDLLGVFGDPAVTGKSADGDLKQGKITTVVAVAFERADPAQWGALHRLLEVPVPHAEDVAQLRDLVTDTGAAAELETIIAERVETGIHALNTASLPEQTRAELATMARACARRSS